VTTLCDNFKPHKLILNAFYRNVILFQYYVLVLQGPKDDVKMQNKEHLKHFFVRAEKSLSNSLK
jgi:hypothetical protein